jgi:hypothetical protein
LALEWLAKREGQISRLARVAGVGHLSEMRKLARLILVTIAGGLILAIAAGVIGEFFIELARQRGWYDNASERLDAAASAFSSFVTQPWFLIITAVLGGLALGVWLDVLLRRADRHRAATVRAARALLTKARPYVQYITGRLKYAHEVCSGVRGAENFYKKLVLQRIDMRNLLEADTENLTERQKEALEGLNIEYKELDKMITYGNKNSARLNKEHIAHLYQQRANKLAISLNKLITELSDGAPLPSDLVPHELMLPHVEEARAFAKPLPSESNEDTSSETYRLLLDFFVEYLQPLESAQRELRQEILSVGVQNERLRSLAMHGIEDNPFFGSVDYAASPLSMSPAVMPSFSALITSIHNAEFSHQQSVDGVTDLVRSLGIRPNELLSQLWSNWHVKHAALIKAYEPIKRDTRFGLLFRPLRENKWGTIPSFEQAMN